ncbi:MAG: GAF domain-containing protein [Alphaproteobacteria bacterium]|nr:GAF domain-containing protein [Alphaproteobacteria bacterium]MBV9061406.1 GAF domain-containing protein [Alphaproteobacteria bacterium]
MEAILDDARALNGAEFGSFQLLSGSRLLIVAQRGFKAPFLRAFRTVANDEGSACGRALKTRKTVLIEDVEADLEFEPFRSVAREAGYRSVATTPLIAADGYFMGVVATHFARVHRPTPFEIESFEAYCVSAAGHLRDLLGGEPLDAAAIRLSNRLYTDMGLPC